MEAINRILDSNTPGDITFVQYPVNNRKAPMAGGVNPNTDSIKAMTIRYVAPHRISVWPPLGLAKAGVIIDCRKRLSVRPRRSNSANDSGL